MSAPVGEYRIWRSRAGAEIWLHYRSPQPDADNSDPAFDPVGDLMGLSVAHAGRSDVRMRIVRSMRLASANPLDGAAVALLPPLRKGDQPLPFVFEHLGFAADRRPLPQEAHVALTGLAQRVWAYPSAAAFLAATPAHRLTAPGQIAEVEPNMLPDVAMIYRPKPRCLWLISGVVRRSIRLVNPLTSAPYVWMHVATDRGDFDVVSSPDRIDGDVSDGHTLQAVVAVTGRVTKWLA